MHRPSWYELQEHLENKTYYAQSAEWNIFQHITMPRQMKVTNSLIECSQATRLIVIGEMHNMYCNDEEENLLDDYTIKCINKHDGNNIIRICSSFI
jgi:hypothetical protein